jgi:type II secretory pathway component GspD/PulD (secretin)
VLVQIAARFVEVTDDGARKLAASDPFMAGLFGGGQPAAPGSAATDVFHVGTAPAVTTGSRSMEQMSASLALLNRMPGVSILSAPTVLTSSGQRAIVEIQQPVSFPGIQATPPAASPDRPESNKTGITLDVLPMVASDGSVVLELVPQVVELTAFNRLAADGSITTERLSSTTPSQLKAGPGETLTPVFSTHKVTTNVAVRDGQTIVLGGLQSAGGMDEQGRALEPRQMLIFITTKTIPAPPAPVPSSPARKL